MSILFLRYTNTSILITIINIFSLCSAVLEVSRGNYDACLVVIPSSKVGISYRNAFTKEFYQNTQPHNIHTVYFDGLAVVYFFVTLQRLMNQKVMFSVIISALNPFWFQRESRICNFYNHTILT